MSVALQRIRMRALRYLVIYIFSICLFGEFIRNSLLFDNLKKFPGFTCYLRALAIFSKRVELK